MDEISIEKIMYSEMTSQEEIRYSLPRYFSCYAVVPLMGRWLLSRAIPLDFRTNVRPHFPGRNPSEICDVHAGKRSPPPRVDETTTDKATLLKSDYGSRCVHPSDVVTASGDDSDRQRSLLEIWPAVAVRQLRLLSLHRYCPTKRKIFHAEKVIAIDTRQSTHVVCQSHCLHSSSARRWFNNRIELSRVAPAFAISVCTFKIIHWRH